MYRFCTKRLFNQLLNADKSRLCSISNFASILSVNKTGSTDAKANSVKKLTKESTKSSKPPRKSSPSNPIQNVPLIRHSSNQNDRKLKKMSTKSKQDIFKPLSIKSAQNDTENNEDNENVGAELVGKIDKSNFNAVFIDFYVVVIYSLLLFTIVFFYSS